MRVLGIDPGLQITGYGVVDFQRKPELVGGGVLRLDAKATLASRLVELESELGALLEEYKPDVCAVEQLYSHYAHPRTAILMGHARGVIFLAGSSLELAVISYSATRIKKTITGAGRASKEQMQMAMLREFHLPKLPEPHDVADAMAVALCHYHASRRTAEEAR